MLVEWRCFRQLSRHSFNFVENVTCYRSQRLDRASCVKLLKRSTRSDKRKLSRSCKITTTEPNDNHFNKLNDNQNYSWHNLCRISVAISVGMKVTADQNFQLFNSSQTKLVWANIEEQNDVFHIMCLIKLGTKATKLRDPASLINCLHIRLHIAPS